MCPVLRQEGTRRGKEGGWTSAQAPTQSPSPGWGFWGSQGPKGIPPVLEDKPSAHLSRPRSHPPPPAHPTQRTMLTLTFVPPQPQKVPLPRCSLQPWGSPPFSFRSWAPILPAGSLQCPHVASPPLLGPISLSLS